MRTLKNILSMSWVLVFDKITVIAILLKSHPSNHYFKIDYFFKIKNSEKKIQVQNKIVADKKKKNLIIFVSQLSLEKKEVYFMTINCLHFFIILKRKKKELRCMRGTRKIIAFSVFV